MSFEIRFKGSRNYKDKTPFARPALRHVEFDIHHLTMSAVHALCKTGITTNRDVTIADGTTTGNISKMKGNLNGAVNLTEHEERYNYKIVLSQYNKPVFDDMVIAIPAVEAEKAKIVAALNAGFMKNDLTEYSYAGTGKDDASSFLITAERAVYGTATLYFDKEVITFDRSIK